MPVLRFSLFFLAVVCALLLALPQTGSAQTVPVRDKSTYGLDAGDGRGDTAFFIGGWTWVTPGFKYTKDSIIPSSTSNYMGPIDGIWPYVNSIGVDVITSPWVLGSFDSVQLYKQVDTLVGDSAFFGSDTARAHLRKPWNKMVVFENKGPLQGAGWGREDQFYPFDSVQSPYDKWKFYYRSSYGSDNINTADLSFLKKSPTGVRERVYDKYTPSGTLICSDIVFTWKPSDSTRVSQNSKEFTDLVRDFAGPPLYLVTTGHLFPAGTADSAAPIFRVELWQEVRPHEHYLDSPTDTLYNNSDTILSFRITSDTVRKSDLTAGGGVIGKYREKSDSVSMIWREDGKPGPYHPNQLKYSGSGKSINIKVYYMGGEQAALRSVAIRDFTGQMLLGQRQYDIARRDSLMNEAARYVRGPGKTAADTNLRPAIIRVYAGEEFEWSEGAGYVAEDALLRQTFHKNRMGGPPDTARVGDSLSAFASEHYWTNFEHLANPDQVTSRVTSSYSGADAGVRYNLIPRLQWENGGTFDVPVLAADDSVATMNRDSLVHRISDGEETFQHGILGQSSADSLGNIFAAYLPGYLFRQIGLLSRQTQRRFILQCPTAGMMSLDSSGDSVAHHMTAQWYEPAELRAMANTALCYGARGMWYTVIGGGVNNFVHAATIGGNVRGIGFNDTFGPGGFDTKSYDTTFNRGTFFLRSAHSTGGTLGHGQIVDSLVNFYAGFGDRTGALRNLNFWLHRVGPELMKIRWREGYSIFYNARRPGILSDSYFTPRSLPSTEIVTAIHSGTVYGRAYGTGKDYVELGLFQTLPGYRDSTGSDSIHHLLSDSRKDTNHVFIVNRRTFECPESYRAGHSAAAAVLDSLSGTSVIRVKFNLPRFNQFNFIRVREVAADTSRLPGTTIPRTALDTIISADSCVLLTLGPGRAALLRITYQPPDESIQAGFIEYSNGKKILFDGRRYHCVYERGENLSGNDINGLDTIFYRRSYPVSDTLGSILWEPVEYPLSKADTSIFPHDTLYWNRHPSITFRALNGDTVVTAVWSCHNLLNGNYSPYGLWRSVMLRNVYTNDKKLGTAQIAPAMETVTDSLWGHYKNDWGTPVISAGDAGEFIAWSDSLRGVVARFRTKGSGTDWWKLNTAYSAIDTVCPNSILMVSKFPSMPPFTRHNADSNAPIVWQAQTAKSDILYSRVYTVPVTGNVSTRHVPYIHASVPEKGYDNFHPSIDEGQDVWSEYQDNITWEGREYAPLPWFLGGFGQVANIQFRSISTERPLPGALRQFGKSSGWGWAKMPLRNSYFSWNFNRFPNVSVLNQHFDVPHDTVHCTATVVFNDSTAGSNQNMWEATVQWADVRFRDARLYNYGGRWQSGASALIPQQGKHAVLYQTTEALHPELRTSRQFFLAKVRPMGYLAQGREVHIPLEHSDTAASGFSLVLNDVWHSDAEGYPVGIVNRDSVNHPVDTLSQAVHLLRSFAFGAHDSTGIGCEVWASFRGDSAKYASSKLIVVADLADSVTGTRVKLLDSFVVTSAAPDHYLHVDTTFDLLSNVYYVRLRVDTVNVPIVNDTADSRYRTAELSSWVEDTTGMGKVHRMPGSAERARISPQPNPFSKQTEIRFSIPASDYVSVAVYGQNGELVRQLVPRTWMEAGRFAVELDGSGLTPGTYVVELRTGGKSVSSKLVLIR